MITKYALAAGLTLARLFGQGQRGEECTYKLTYASVPAVNVSIGMPYEGEIQGRRAVQILAVAKTSALFSPFYSLENRYETWIDKETGVPLKYFKKIHQKTLDQFMTVHYDRTHNTAWYVGGKFPNDTTVSVQPQCHNLFSMIYALRQRPLSKGDVVSYPLDVETEAWKVTVTAEAEESVACAGQKFDAVKVRFDFSPIGEEKKRKGTDILTRRVVRSQTRMWFWIAKQSPRYFLKVEIESSPFNVVTQLTKIGS